MSEQERKSTELSSKVDALKATISAKEVSIQETQKSCQKYEKECDMLKQSGDDKMNQLLEKIETLESKHAFLEKEKQVLEGKVQLLDETTASFKEEKVKVKKLTKRNLDLQSEMEKLGDELADVKKALKAALERENEPCVTCKERDEAEKSNISFEEVRSPDVKVPNNDHDDCYVGDFFTQKGKPTSSKKSEIKTGSRAPEHAPQIKQKASAKKVVSCISSFM